MDDKGFIFTTDAVLGLVVVIVFTASLITYFALPAYNGEEHQHLQALADSAMSVMEQDGSLRIAAVQNARGNSTGAQLILNSELELLIPDSVAYNITIGSTNPVSAMDNRGLLYATDTVTKVKVISGPQEGWMGRAWYKLEEVPFKEVNDTTVTTVWTFHNYLTSIQPWYNYGMVRDHYWGGTNVGSGQTPVNILFNIPNTGAINNIKMLMGSSGNKPFGTDFVVNNVNHNIVPSSNFLYAYNIGNTKFFNTYQNIDTSQFNSGQNNFYNNFLNVSSANNMPWFSIIANYTTTYNIPQGVNVVTFNFPDMAGVGRNVNPSIIFDPTNGNIQNTASRSISWNYLKTNDYNLNTPFEITGMTNINRGSAVGIQQDVYLPPGNRLFDAYVVINPYAGTDGIIVQVKDSTGNWNTVFTSFDSKYSARSNIDGGYGNIPGILDLRDYIKTGHNTIRIISYDAASTGNYDLTGLINCYAKLTYSTLPIRWDTFSFDSYQNTSYSNTKRYTGKESFTIDSEAQSALLFFSGAMNTRNVIVTVYNDTDSSILYSGTVPYVLNLEELDATKTKHIITNLNANGTYTLKPGSYDLTVEVIPSKAWESGDGGNAAGISYYADADPALYSGTRISIMYPKFLQNIWATSYASSAAQAEYQAQVNLNNTLTQAGINVDPNLIKAEAMYTGDLPNAIPVRLNLWKQ